MQTKSYVKNTLKEESTVDNYLIKRILGIGGFGVTYLAEDLNLKREVAIKEYFPQEIAVREENYSITPKSYKHEEPFTAGVEKFSKEASSLAQFNHPNIVRVLNFFSANGTAYFVMEYERGLSLESYLVRRNKAIDEEELLEIFHPILDGLKMVHQFNMLHRDIKPANIYLRSNGAPLLIDFGAARYALGQASRSLSMVLTEGYAPFEQYRSDAKNQGPWTDLYALGATMYRCISLKIPPRAPDRFSPDGDTNADPYVPAVKIGDGKYSTQILEAIDSCMAVASKKRPQTVAELQQMLPPGRLGPMSQEKLERVEKYRTAVEFAWEPDHLISKQERENLTLYQNRLQLSDFEARIIEREVTGENFSVPPDDEPVKPPIGRRLKDIIDRIGKMNLIVAVMTNQYWQGKTWFKQLELRKKWENIKSANIFKKLKNVHIFQNLRWPAFLKKIQIPQYIWSLVEKYQSLEIGKKIRSLKIVQIIQSDPVFVSMKHAFQAIPHKKYITAGLGGIVLLALFFIFSQPPEAPATFNGQIAPNRTVKLSWKQIDSPSQFILERSENKADFVPIANIKGEQRLFVDKNVKPGITYIYRMLSKRWWQQSEFCYTPELFLNILIVSPEPGASLRSISQAVQAAKPGMTISVEPGVYQDSVVIDKSLKIIADDEADSVIIQGIRVPAITVNTPEAEIRNVFIRQLESEANSPAVQVTNGGLLLDNCDISSQAGPGLSVAGSAASSLVQNSKIHSGMAAGIDFSDHARGVIKNCEIFENKAAGISISDSANVQIDSCKIFDGSSYGILFNEKGLGQVQNSRIFQNQNAGIKIMDGSMAQLDSCRIFSSRRQGILVQRKGEGEIVNCKISANNGSGIEILNGFLKVDSCEISDGRSNGVVLSAYARARFTKCVISRNYGNGVVVSKNSSPTFISSTIGYCSKSGITLTENAKGRFEWCHIVGNKGNQVYSLKSTPTFSDCNIYDGKSNGIVLGYSKGIFNECKVYRHAQNGIVIKSKSNPQIRWCKISQSDGHGIDINRADADINYCEIFKNKKSGVLIHNYGSPNLRECKIRENSDYGIDADQTSNGFIQRCVLTNNRVPTRILSKLMVQSNNTVR